MVTGRKSLAASGKGRKIFESTWSFKEKKRRNFREYVCYRGISSGSKKKSRRKWKEPQEENEIQKRLKQNAIKNVQIRERIAESAGLSG